MLGGGLVSDQWGPRPGGIQVPRPPAPARRSNGCLVAFMWLMAAWGAVFLPIGLAGLASGEGEGAVGVVVFSLVLLGVPFAYWRKGVSRDREARERYEAAMSARQANAEQWANTRPSVVIAQEPDALQAAQRLTRHEVGCAFLGVKVEDESWVTAQRQQAVLVLGPPRSGKTRSIVVPSVLNASGPVVSTSTKLEVLNHTARSRSRMGRVWLFDPSASEPEVPGVLQLHWSPIWQSRTWDGARAVADAMVGASAAGGGVENGSYWTESAKTLLAPLLHAAAVSGRSVLDVRRWVLQEKRQDAVDILDHVGATLAADELDSLTVMKDDRLRSNIYASTKVALSAYGSEGAAQRSTRQNFDADAFVRSSDTIYITAPSNLQTNLAPLVAGLLEEIRGATYRFARSPEYSDQRDHPVLWALDEVANIAPLKGLPAIVSEAGGQGLQVMACLQDLSQARNRWGGSADGFLSLFGTKVVFPGIGDKLTLEALSVLAGDWDRPVHHLQLAAGLQQFAQGGSTQGGEAWTWTTQREAQISPSEIANIPVGQALLMRPRLPGEQLHWTRLRTVPLDTKPWDAVLAQAPAAIEEHGNVDTLPLPDWMEVPKPTPKTEPVAERKQHGES